MNFTFSKTICTLMTVALSFSMAAKASEKIDTPAKQAIMIEASTGAVLFEKNSDEQMAPSSMSKLLTVYMAFDQLKTGSLKLEDRIPMSRDAFKGWANRGSTMFIAERDKPTVKELLLGIIVQSGNDACVVIAEGIAGSVPTFVEWMNDKAEELGMTNTHIMNPNGWPHKDHYMSARDLAILSQRIAVDFPEYYEMFAIKEFTYNKIRQFNRNPILQTMSEADGLKTGHTEAGGYGLTASAVRDGRSLILVLNGLKSAKSRSRESERLMRYGFRNFKLYELLKASTAVDTAKVWLGSKASVPLMIEKDVTLSLSVIARRKMKVKIIYDGPIPAPIKKGQALAILQITSPKMETLEFPLVAGEDVDKLGGIARIKAAFNYLLLGSSASE
jgi:D-alanyl-D-alanine carboxypeptidase (penicillin-binding protein 5/6)